MSPGGGDSLSAAAGGPLALAAAALACCPAAGAVVALPLGPCWLALHAAAVAPVTASTASRTAERATGGFSMGMDAIGCPVSTNATQGERTFTYGYRAH